MTRTQSTRTGEESRQRLEAAYHLHAGAIHRFCWRLLPDRQAAEDAAAGVFLNLARRWGQLEHRDEASLRHWLYGEARNVIRAQRRRQARDDEALRGMWHCRRAEPAPDGQSAPAMDPARLQSALERLGAGDRELIALRYMEGLSPKETAAILGKSRVAVRVALMRALRRLKKHLGGPTIE